MGEITLKEAREYAKQMGNFFKAFRFVDETLEKAVASEELVERFEEKLGVLQKEIEKAERERVELLEVISGLKATLLKESEAVESSIKLLNENKAKMVEEVEREKKVLMGELEKHKTTLSKEYEVALSKHKEALKELESEYQTKLSELKAAQLDAEKKLSATLSKLSEIKESLAV